MTPDEIAALHAKIDAMTAELASFKLDCALKFAKADRQFWALIALLVGSGLLTASQVVGL